MFVFRKTWRALFSWNTRFEIRPFALLPFRSYQNTSTIFIFWATCQFKSLMIKCNYRFEGLNIMLVTMTSRLIPMLSSLMEDMKSKTDMQCKNLPCLEECDIYSCTSPWKRMLVMMHTISIPSLLIDLFFAAHEKVLVIFFWGS